MEGIEVRIVHGPIMPNGRVKAYCTVIGEDGKTKRYLTSTGKTTMEKNLSIGMWK